MRPGDEEALDALYQGTTLVGPKMAGFDEGLRGCVRTAIYEFSPVGTAHLAQDASPGLDLKGLPYLAGTAENRPRRNPPSAVPAGLSHVA